MGYSDNLLKEYSMFPWYIDYNRLLESVSKVPKETIVAGVAAYVVIDIHKRNTQVKIAEAKARIRGAELEVEALKLKRELQKNFSLQFA
jgi:hypothetical protein